MRGKKAGRKWCRWYSFADPFCCTVCIVCVHSVCAQCVCAQCVCAQYVCAQCVGAQCVCVCLCVRACVEGIATYTNIQGAPRSLFPLSVSRLVPSLSHCLRISVSVYTLPLSCLFSGRDRVPLCLLLQERCRGGRGDHVDIQRFTAERRGGAAGRWRRWQPRRGGQEDGGGGAGRRGNEGARGGPVFVRG